MRFLFIVYSVLLIIMCIMMQQQSVQAKPFIFFLPQVPPRANSNLPAPSTSFTTNIDFTSILSNKLNLLTSLLQSGLNSGGFTFGFNKVLPNIQATAVGMKVPNISTTTITPDTVFKPESLASAVSDALNTSIASTASTALTASTPSSASPGLRTLATTISTAESSKTIEEDSGTGTGSHAATDKNNNDNITSEVKTKQIDNEGSANSGDKVTTVKSGNEYNTAKITNNQSQNTDNDGHITANVIDGRNNNNSDINNDNSDTISSVTTDKTNGYEYPTPKISYSYDFSNHAMNENEISNEIMMINNQYLPVF